MGGGSQLDFWGLFVSEYSSFGLGIMGLERGSLHEVFTLLTLFFDLFIFCFHAIMQVQDQKKRKSFSQQSSKTEITDLKLKSIKNSEKSAKSNRKNYFSCTICRHHGAKKSSQ